MYVIHNILYNIICQAITLGVHNQSTCKYICTLNLLIIFTHILYNVMLYNILLDKALYNYYDIVLL